MQIHIVLQVNPNHYQGRTKQRPKNPKIQKLRFLKIAISFPSLIPCLIPPRDDRAKSDTTPCLQKVLFLKIAFLKRLTLLLKRLSPFLKKLTYIPKKFPLFLKKCTFPQKKCIFLYILTSFSSLPYYLCSRFRKNTFP